MKKTLKLLALMLVLVMALGMLAACGDSNANTQSPDPVVSDSQPVDESPAVPDEPSNDEPAVDAIDRAEYGIPAEYTKVKIIVGTYGFGDAELAVAMTDDESAFYITFTAFDEEQILEGTVANGICIVSYDATGFMSGDCQLMVDDALASSEPWHALTGGDAASSAPTANAADYGIPAGYTKLKVFVGTYGFGDAELAVAMNDDESAFYITFTAFDEDQVLEGTVANGICIVSYDATGFMSGDCQLMVDDALASSEPWYTLAYDASAVAAVARADYGIPEEYTKVKIFVGTYGFGDAELAVAMNDDESAFYIAFTAFDEEQILEGTIANGICIVSYDATGFMSGDCQLMVDDALASSESWAPLQ